MLPFFTNPYPDELLYSAIARYHFYSGNLDCKDTLEELFGSRSVIPSVEIGSNFTILAEKLGHQYSVESLLTNHTIYPYYASFLSKQRQQEILENVKGDGQGLYTRLGIVAGGICRKDGLYYCSTCAKADAECYGEPYIHREHQLQGIDYCSHHEIPLRKYPKTNDSRIEYIRFELKHMDLSPLYEIDSHKELAIHLAKQAYKLLNLPLHYLSREQINSKYRTLLREYNLITSSNRVRQQEMYQAIKSTLPNSFLQRYESAVNNNDEYNWLRILTRNLKRHVHPFRHLLFLYFLQYSVEKLVDIDEDDGAFGRGPFSCLNKAAAHYKKFIISNVIVTRDFKTKNLIGTFTCSCGFIYSRKHTTDMFEIGRIKAFGDVWLEKLHDLQQQNLSIRAIARELGVDFKTVKRYLIGNVEIKQVKSHRDNDDILGIYKQDLLKEIKKHPNLSRTALRNKYKKQYMYLYRYDKVWLDEALPERRYGQNTIKKVNWAKRDQQYVQEINRLHQKLLQSEKPIRITISKIGKSLGTLANLEQHLNKLPKTNKLLNDIVESVKDFQLRRCYKIIDDLLENDQEIFLWQIQRKAAIKSHHFHAIQPMLESYIEMKQEVTNNERTTS
ncbi:TnsD family Tn7-like transposition protein [Lysinibacillus piscis]|uniref:Transposase n=1 Tax=Lysinibacillus piscis TaxID=2518931 RepID=A0ABQ5NN87_9BACI|nr:TnsD family Tn7-like transposition protein [Lysinibacillus sp. KH24]GLC89705.1 hypothetical protein LYSBPC_28320 [Lysinibacillus sp. KH24]